MGSSDEESFENKLYSNILDCINTDENWFQFDDYNEDNIRNKSYVKNLVPINFLTIDQMRFFAVKEKIEYTEDGVLQKRVDISIVVSDLQDEENLMCLIDYRRCYEKDNYQLKKSDDLLYWIKGLNQGGLYGINWERRGQQCGLVPAAHRALISNNLQPLHYYFKPPTESFDKSPMELSNKASTSTNSCTSNDGCLTSIIFTIVAFITAGVFVFKSLVA